MNTHSWTTFCAIATLVLGPSSLWAQTNSWTSPASGRWDDLSWSLGVRPANTQTIAITNSGSKAVAIQPDTPINFPNTMTISNLLISAPTGYANTLLLNFSGVGNPLRVLNRVDVMSGGALNVQYGSLIVSSNCLVVGASLVVEGGFLSVTNGSCSFVNATSILNQAQCILSNAGAYQSSSIIQSGGELRGRLQLYDGSYFLSNGIFRGSMTVGDFGSQLLTGSVYQTGGTNFADIYLSKGFYGLTNGRIVGNIGMGREGSLYQVNGSVSGSIGIGGYAGYFGGSRYSMQSGTNFLGGISTAAGGNFHQDGGINRVTNGVSASGYFDTYGPVGFGAYYLTDGLLTCSNIDLGLFGGFNQSGGTNLVSAQITVNGGGGYSLGGGTLQTSNTIVSAPYYRSSDITFTADFDQSAGTHTVTDTLAVYGTYNLSGGVLSAQNVILMSPTKYPSIITSNATASPVIVNPGQFVAGGMLKLSGSIQQLGVLRLAGNSTFDFTGTPGQLKFLNSSAASWTNGAILVITNWIGSTNGGGANRLIVGNSANGLNASQIATIRFVNPSGLPAGTYFAGILGSGEIVPVVHNNSWTGSSSGIWDNSTRWSTGLLPTYYDSVFITNAVSKAVAIQPSTPVNNPGSMTIRDLTIDAPNGSTNTLLLNFSGTATPLHILESCWVGKNGAINNQYGGLLIDGSGTALTVAGGLIQEGGALWIPNGELLLNTGTARITNATWVLEDLQCVSNSVVVQSGGSLLATNAMMQDGSQYDLIDATFHSPLIVITGSSFRQNGGTNFCGDTPYRGLGIGDGSSYFLTNGVFRGRIEMGGGLFFGKNANLRSDVILMYNGSFVQDGGSADVKDLVALTSSSVQSSYILTNNAVLHSGAFSLHGYFLQSGAVHLVTNEARISFIGLYTLASGLMASASLSVFDGTFRQDGGMNVVTNTLLDRGVYILNGGTLSASNIVVAKDDYNPDADLMISNAPIIINPGQFSLFGRVVLAGSVQQLGTLLLTGDSLLDFTAIPGQLKFLNSSSAPWTDATLVVSNWNGSVNGNGLNCLMVGTNTTGLTHAQLARIRFINPAGLPSGTYFADILSTGEIIPTVRPYLVATRSGTGIVFSWPNTFTLESATNINGPYGVVPGVTTPPFTNGFDSKRFFRLRK